MQKCPAVRGPSRAFSGCGCNRCVHFFMVRLPAPESWGCCTSKTLSVAVSDPPAAPLSWWFRGARWAIPPQCCSWFHLCGCCTVKSATRLGGTRDLCSSGANGLSLVNYARAGSNLSPIRGDKHGGFARGRAGLVLEFSGGPCRKVLARARLLSAQMHAEFIR
jgi:hypothetical protein